MPRTASPSMNLLCHLFALIFLLTHGVVFAEAPVYVPATAFYIMPETTSEESGYFSLSESLDGAIHIGTAKYNHNAFLVEFDPKTGKQQIVLDTNKTCGLSASGYAAQAKLHTRNFVGPSGRVYVGSKQGYRAKDDTSDYPGGYVMVYDPRSGHSENLGMPLPGQGIIDVVADESRDRIYAVTCEEQHWMIGKLAGTSWKELGPLLTPFATTLVDSRGVASSITKEFELAQYDPATERITSRPIMVGGQRWTRADNNAIPIWQLDPDGRHAWLTLMNDPTLLCIDLQSAGEHANAENCGRFIEGKNPDCRSALTIHPDGRIYALVRIDNTTGFGTGYLHHLVRYDPVARKHEDLGVLKVRNPDYFDWTPGPDGKAKPWTHGFHRLPDGTLTPLHAHLALLAARDGTLYATVLYPFTLLKIDSYKLPAPAPGAASLYLDALGKKLDAAATRIPEISQLAERLAERHLHGGMIGFPWIGSTLEQELVGRSGGLMNVSFDRSWKKERTAEEKANDMMIFAWDDAPKPGDLKRLQEEKGKGLFIIGFGARKSPLLTEHVAACDAWIDSGADGEDRVVPLSGSRLAGKTNHFTNAVNGWLLMGEFVGALTRHGRMPTMWKSWSTIDGHAWSDRYSGKMQFHDDFTVVPVAPGELGKRYLSRIRYLIARMERVDLPSLQKMAEQIDAELREGRKTIVASSGHMAMNYIGRFDDAIWAVNKEVHGSAEAQMQDYEKTPENALVLRLGEWGLDRSLHDLFQKKHQRVMIVTGENPRPEFAVPSGYSLQATYGASFGDACVWLEGYPMPILPPSGVMQIAAFESINVEVQRRQLP
ncbi:MAG: hypothetical protein JWL59_3187 [Chthoniobacteraceae bacterium]|nr:hypothetical protein [Chthoniobacteraceae bacterium]